MFTSEVSVLHSQVDSARGMVLMGLPSHCRKLQSIGGMFECLWWPANSESVLIYKVADFSIIEFPLIIPTNICLEIPIKS